MDKLGCPTENTALANGQMGQKENWYGGLYEAWSEHTKGHSLKGLQIHTHTHTRMHAHTHTHTHTRTHTHAQTQCW